MNGDIAITAVSGLFPGAQGAVSVEGFGNNIIAGRAATVTFGERIGSAMSVGGIPEGAAVNGSGKGGYARGAQP